MILNRRVLLPLLLLVLLPLLLSGFAVVQWRTGASLHSHTILNEMQRGAHRQLKHNHLILGPAAGEGLPGRVQCEGMKAVTNKKKSGNSCLSQGERVSIVTVFVPRNERQSDVEIHELDDGKLKLGNETVCKADRPYAIIKIFLESIKISMSGSETILVSDLASQFPANKLPEDVTIERIEGNYASNNLMLQRLESYIDFLKRTLASLMQRKTTEKAVKHIIFMDSDIIVVDDLGCVFKIYTSFDVGLTFRNNKGQPLNSGVILVRGLPESISRAIRFLEGVVKVYKERFIRAARMLGDQLSLAWVVNQSNVGPDSFKQTNCFEKEILGVKILFLPCANYNWTPAEGAGQFHGMPEDVQVIHFKGSRKRLMIEAWNFFKASQGGFSDMKCLILKSGRTKYDF